MTSTEDQLRSSLHARAERAAYQPTAVADVAARARVIRRRRTRTAVLAAAAAVVALALPAIVVLGGDDARNTQPAEPGPTTDLNAADADYLAGLEQGPPPTIGYLDGSDYVSGTGRTTIPVRQSVSITPYQGGYLVVSELDHPAKVGLTRLDGNLDTVWSRCGGGIVVSRDRAQTAYLSGPCDSRQYTLSVGPTNGVDEQNAGPAASVLGILDDGRVVYAAEARADIGMLVSDLAGAPEPVTPPGGPVDLDEAHELVAGVEDIESPVTALAWRLATGEVTWRGAQGAGTTWIPSRFSPDGLHLLAAADDGTGMRNGFLDAATGAYVSDFELPPDVRIHDAAWEDDQHVLVSVSEGLARAILRVDLDGRITRAADGTERSPYNFAVQP